jgi:hypothetical protein
MYLRFLPYDVRREALRIMAYYEIHGRASGLSPYRAAWATLLEFADAFRELGMTEEQEDDVASSLYYFNVGRGELPERWKAAAVRAVARIRKRSEARAAANAAFRNVERDRTVGIEAASPPVTHSQRMLNVARRVQQRKVADRLLQQSRHPSFLYQKPNRSTEADSTERNTPDDLQSENEPPTS